jgi:hypothetical protein
MDGMQKTQRATWLSRESGSLNGVVGQGRRMRKLNLRVCVCAGSPHCIPTPVSGKLVRLLLYFFFFRLPLFFFGGLLWLI